MSEIYWIGMELGILIIICTLLVHGALGNLRRALDVERDARRMWTTVLREELQAIHARLPAKPAPKKKVVRA